MIIIIIVFAFALAKSWTRIEIESPVKCWQPLWLSNFTIKADEYKAPKSFALAVVDKHILNRRCVWWSLTLPGEMILIGGIKGTALSTSTTSLILFDPNKDRLYQTNVPCKTHVLLVKECKS